MRRLILFRHAKAAHRARGGTDRDRPLEPVGQREAEISGRWMAATGLAPDLVLVSPSARTVQTWDEVKTHFPRAKVEVLDDLYDATPEDIEMAIAGPTRAAQDVLLIGHNPGMQELAMNLLVEGGASSDEVEKVAGGFPTSTVAVIAMGEGGAARLEAMFNPRRDTPPPYVEAWDEEPGAGS
ncbi:MAG TPA: histidine phosphatase family protein [Caulobacteraceae bacterium]|nr:histidine phosphatase family protein [Caulobacteraceae bacterium]